MRKELLASVAALGLLSFGSAAWAEDDNNANANTGSAITQDEGGDVVASGGTAVVEGAYSGGGNAIGEFSDNNAVADTSSHAVQLVAPDGVADDGSALTAGDGNAGASAAKGSAATTGSASPATSTENYVTDGSAHVIGSNNLTAAAEEGGAAVGANGTAVGINDVDIHADAVTAAFGGGNVVSAAHLQEVATFSTNLELEGGLEVGVNGFFFDAEAKLAGALAYGDTAAITTGSINNNAVGTLTGANMFAGNTGVANQGDAIGIAANTSF